MSKERARRREERQRESAVSAAARAAEVERRGRRDARLRAVTSRLPRGRRGPRGVLAERRRKQVWVTALLLVLVNVVVWAVASDWPARAMVLVVSLLSAPVLHTLLFRRT